MTYRIAITKPYRDILQIDGKQIVIESKLRFYIDDINQYRLVEVIAAAIAAGYSIEEVMIPPN